MPKNTTAATPSVTLWSNIKQFCSKPSFKDAVEIGLELEEAQTNLRLGFFTKAVEDFLIAGLLIDASAVTSEWENYISQYVTNPIAYEAGKQLESVTVLFLGAYAMVEGLQGLASINWNGVLETFNAGSSFTPVLVEGGVDAFGAASAAELLKTAGPSLAELLCGYAFARLGSEGVAKSAHMMGESGTKYTSHSSNLSNGGRIDSENPNPGQRPGQIHYQDGNGGKWWYNPDTKAFYNDPQMTELAPSRIQKLLEDQEVIDAILKELKYLGEMP